jgi:hypothetical protein
MARSKQKVTAIPEEEAAPQNAPSESEKPTEAQNEVGESTSTNEALDAFLARLQGMASFDGGLVWVDCPLEGYKGVRVAFNTDNRYAVEELYRTRPQGLKAADSYRLWSLFIRRIEWPFGIPAPTPDDPQTYEALVSQFNPLAVWCIGEGYNKAKDARWGNS